MWIHKISNTNKIDFIHENDKIPLNLKNDQISLKPLKWPKYSRNFSNDQNTQKNSKIMNIPLKSLKWQQKMLSNPLEWGKEKI